MHLRSLLLGAAFALTAASAAAQVPGYPAFFPPLTTGDCVQATSPFQATTVSAPCGAGTVSAGLINQLAWYAASGNALSGLATGNSGVLITSAGGVPSISSTLPSGLIIPSPTLSGTVTLPDTATWSASGLSDTTNYATSTLTPPIDFSITNSYSSTSSSVIGARISTTMKSTGASSGTVVGTRLQTIIDGSSNNIGTIRGLLIDSIENVGYTGTITNWNGITVSAPTVSGNPIGTMQMINFGPVTNGNGITTGSVVNAGLVGAAFTAAAASGGTITNEVISATVPTGSGAGTTTNRGIYITGNGGSGGGGSTTNYALLSDSTAASQLGGTLNVGANSTDYVQMQGGASGATINTNGGTLTLASGGGTTTAITDTAPTMANLASSAAALDAVCWNAGTGVLTHNGAGALCSASLEELKDKIADILPSEALAEVMMLKPFWGKFKDGVTTTSDHRISPMLGAHAVEAIDSRLSEYTSDGELHGVRYTNLTALLIAAVQEQQAQIDNIARRANDNRAMFGKASAAR